MNNSFLVILSIFILVIACQNPSSEPEAGPVTRPESYLQISGIYPHLTAYNQPQDSAQWSAHRECGIGAVVPWADHLWYITYPPHMRTGSNDKLYMVDKEMNLTIRPESVGGTHANRMIHKESNQLVIGPYFIDSIGNVRTADVQQLEGRMTATTRHLFYPNRLVYFYEMEGFLYEVDVVNLAVTKVYDKPVPGWHGKGAYLGQGRLIVANNGEHQGHPMGYSKLLVGGEAKSKEEAGVLGEWDGKEWRIVERKQFTDVTGPGGIYGNDSEEDPIWSMGWDKRSVILKLLDGGEWYTYRLPKASHTFDPRHGWFTEWPRIRAISLEQMMMVMHGSMLQFPKTFSRANSSGITPIATHLRYIPDFCYWDDRLILAADDASRMQNPIVGQPQSNLWFGEVEDLSGFGPKAGWGGVWLKDEVKANKASDPFLINGYDQRILHLAHETSQAVTFALEIDQAGNGEWSDYASVKVPSSGYAYKVFPKDLTGTWLRIKTDKNTMASAYFHYYTNRAGQAGEEQLFKGLAAIEEDQPYSKAMIRPAGHNKSLQLYFPDEGKYQELSLSEAEADLVYSTIEEDRSAEVKELARLNPNSYTLDKASVVIQDFKGQRYRLPKGPEQYEQLWSLGHGRVIREVQSERYLANVHGLFYEIPRAEGAGNHVPDYQKIKPVTTHNKKIVDYCSWRGLLVLSGVSQGAEEDGQVFTDEQGSGLWFGNIDDLWKFGKPVGVGGPWKNTTVEAGKASDPYIMTGFDKKKVDLSHDSQEKVTFTLEVATNHEEWHTFHSIEVEPNSATVYIFPDDYHAHWVRLKTDKSCRATAIFTYE